MESRLSMQKQATLGAVASQIEHLPTWVEQLGGCGGGGGGGGGVGDTRLGVVSGVSGSVPPSPS
jgi:hypothetical protein